MLWATWVEHAVNSLLMQQCRRKRISEKSIRELLRGVNLAVKTTGLWELAGLPTVDPVILARIKRISEQRNSFVHYKWPSWDYDLTPDAEQDAFQRIREDVRLVVEALAHLDDLAFWGGRREEILAEYDSP